MENEDLLPRDGMGANGKYPGLNGAFADHGTVANSIVSAGAWPRGAPFKEDPVVDIPEVEITVGLVNGEITLRWEASPVAGYTVLASGLVAGPYKPTGEGLKFNDGAGSFSVKADQFDRFFIIQAK